MIDYTFLLPGKNDGRYLAGPGAIHGSIYKHQKENKYSWKRYILFTFSADIFDEMNWKNWNKKADEIFKNDFTKDK